MASRLSLWYALFNDSTPPEEVEKKLGIDTSGAEEALEGREKLWSSLARRILYEYRNSGFVSAIVYGRLGAGKSVYSIKVARQVLSELGFHVDFDIFLREYFVFELSRLLQLVYKADTTRIPVVVWDDAGVSGGAYEFFTNIHHAKAIANVFRVIRTRVASIILTTPIPQDILKPIRSQETLYVRIVRVDERRSEAHGYSMTVLPSGEHRFRKVFVDRYSPRLPDRDYRIYYSYRDSYVKFTIEELFKLMTLRETATKIDIIKLKKKIKKAAEDGLLDMETSESLLSKIERLEQL